MCHPLTFSRCVLDNTNTEPEPSGEEGLADVRIVEAIFKAAEQGQAVRLTPFVRRRRPDMGQELHKPPVRKQQPLHSPSPTLR